MNLTQDRNWGGGGGTAGLGETPIQSLTLGTLDVWVRTILCWVGHSGHCWKFSSAPLPAKCPSTVPPVMTTKNHRQMFLGRRKQLPPIENH